MNYPSLEIIKSQPRIMQNFIKLKEGRKLSLSSCYQCIALMWGFESWNEFCTQLNKEVINEIRT